MTNTEPPRLDDAERARLRERLEASRGALLAALEDVTERDFTTNLGDGVTAVRLLAGLVTEEQADVARLRGQTVVAATPQRPLPPQVVHGLAGARYQTLRALDAPGLAPEAAQTLVAGIETREQAAAERIRARPAAPPPPVIPVIQPPPA